METDYIKEKLTFEIKILQKRMRHDDYCGHIRYSCGNENTVFASLSRLHLSFCRLNIN